MSVFKTLAALKQNDQDFEWYPTTNEMLDAIYEDCVTLKKRNDVSNFIDVGCGNAKFYTYLNSKAERDERVNYNLFASYRVLEKSEIHLANLPKFARIVGTDFNESTLMDKKADAIFCNPPYSEYVTWVTRIIKEANANYIYLVIPKRWGHQVSIAKAIKARKAKVNHLGSFDFIQSEERKARAVVSVLRVDLNCYKYHKRRKHSDRPTVDPFGHWFYESFEIDAAKDERDVLLEKNRQRTEKIENAVVAGNDLISRLVQLYDQEVEHLISNYQTMSALDAELLSTFNINIEHLLENFKEKICNIKIFYWEKVFANFEMITSRLISNKRDHLMQYLTANTNIDFTQSNIRAIILWVVQHSSDYLQEQLITMHDSLFNSESIRLYRSNERVTKDTWRYLKQKEMLNKGIKYALDYRVIAHHNYVHEWSHDLLSETKVAHMNDIFVIAKSLGFLVDDIISTKSYQDTDRGVEQQIYMQRSRSRVLPVGTKTHQGKIEEVYEDENTLQYKIEDQWFNYTLITTDEDIFCTFRVYKNGNIHYKFNQKFMAKFNVEVGRLRNWIKSPEEAAQELNISLQDASSAWCSLQSITSSDVKNLLPATASENETVTTQIDEEENNSLLYTEEQMKTFQEGTLF